MRKTIKRILIAAFSATMGLAVANSASAEELNVDTYLGWLSVGTVHTIQEGHLYFVGEFSGSVTDMGAGTILDGAAQRCPAWFDINYLTGVLSAGGHCVITLSTGDAFFGSWECDGLLGASGPGGYLPLGPNACVGGLTVTGATGALEGMTGGNIFEGFTLLFHPDGKGSGYNNLQYSLNLP